MLLFKTLDIECIIANVKSFELMEAFTGIFLVLKIEFHAFEVG